MDENIPVGNFESDVRSQSVRVAHADDPGLEGRLKIIPNLASNKGFQTNTWNPTGDILRIIYIRPEGPKFKVG